MCTRCGGSGSTKSSRNTRSHYNSGEHRAPAQQPPVIVSPMPRRSMFRDAAAVAGGVTVGTTMGFKKLATPAIIYCPLEPKKRKRRKKTKQDKAEPLPTGDLILIKESMSSTGSSNHYHSSVKDSPTPDQPSSTSEAGSQVISSNIDTESSQLVQDTTTSLVRCNVSKGHLAGEAISGLFGGRHRREVEEALPRHYQTDQPPTGPCAYEIATFLQCAVDHDSLTDCAAFNEALKSCKKRNGIP